MEVSSISGFLSYADKIHSRTARLIALLRDRDLDYRIRPDAFSAGELVLHIAETKRYLFARNALGLPSTYKVSQIKEGETAKGLYDYFTGMHKAAMEELSALDDGMLQQKITVLGGADMTIDKWLRAMIEHEIHHRGQLYVYLGMMGTPTPPIFGYTADEVVGKSV